MPGGYFSNANAMGNINNGTCSYACPGGQSRVKIQIVNDNYPQETSWTLKNGSTPSRTVFGLRRYLECWWIVL